MEESSMEGLTKRQRNAIDREDKTEMIARTLAQNPLVFMKFATSREMVFFNSDYLTVKRAENRALQMLSQENDRKDVS